MVFVFLAYIPATVFWGLDGFFLWQEQLYRKLYDHGDPYVEGNGLISSLGGKSRTLWSI